MSRTFRRLVGPPLIAGLLVLLLGSIAISWAGLHDSPHEADMAVVLGNMVLPDGTPSNILRERLDHAADLYQKGYFKLILVSGGLEREGQDEPDVMRRYLETKGIPSEAIIEDDDGYTTWKTAQSTTRILRERHLTSVIAISQYFHTPRCRLAFSRFGIKTVYSSHAPVENLHELYLGALPREVLGYLAYSFRSTSPSESRPHVD